MLNAITDLSNALDIIEAQKSLIERNALASMKNGYKRATIGIENEVRDDGQGFASALDGKSRQLRVSVGRDLSTGDCIQTDSPTHLALQSEGFFKFKDNDGTFVYSRDGALQKNKKNQLENILHQTLLSSDGSPITVDPEIAQVDINIRGEVFQKGQLIGKIGVFNAPRLGPHLKDNRGGFTVSENAEKLIKPVDIQKINIIQGSLENANSSMMEESTELIQIQSLHQILSRSISDAGKLRGSINSTLHGN